MSVEVYPLEVSVKVSVRPFSHLLRVNRAASDEMAFAVAILFFRIYTNIHFYDTKCNSKKTVKNQNALGGVS